MDPSHVPEVAQPGSLSPHAHGAEQAGETPVKQAPAAKAKPRLPSRFFEFFWRGRALRGARVDLVQAPVRLKQLHQRARTCFAAAQSALNPRGVGPWTYAPYLASDLFRQSCHWALAAITLGDDEPEAVWSRADRELLLKAAGNADNLEQLRPHIVQRSFVHFAQLTLEEQKALASGLQAFAGALLRVLEEPQRKIDRLWRQRVVRVGAVLTLFALLGLGNVLYAQHKRDASDIAHGKPWRASSEWAKCEPATHRCGGLTKTDIFFHTNEQESPWLELDLGSRQRFSSILIENRKDCCLDRAIPLVFEVSDDRQKWREVVRRTKPFRDWEQDIAPQTARYVRLYIARRSTLHLERVGLFP
jgi:hypothetical protein